MPVYRDIDYDTRINGSLEVLSTSEFKDSVSIANILSVGEMADVVSAINSKLSLSANQQTIVGNITITGNLNVDGDISGIDLSQYYTKADLNSSSGIGQVHWDRVSSKPATFTPSAHDHNSLYYTHSEVNAKLATKSGIDHDHDSRYFPLNGGSLDGELSISSLGMQLRLVNKSNDKIWSLGTSDENITLLEDGSVPRLTFLEGGGISLHGGSIDGFSLSSISNSIDSHIDDDIVHVSSGERADWNAAHSHSEDSEIHLTAAQKTGLTSGGSTSLHSHSIYAVSSDVYTKSNLQSSGQASVHWGNLTNVPSDLGYWKYKIGSTEIEVNGGDTVTLLAGAGISLSQDGGIKVSATPYTAGDGLSLSGFEFTNTDKGSSQAIFKNVKVGASTLSASSNSDTLSFLGSGQTSVSLDTSAKTITISSTSYEAGTNLSLSGSTFSVVNSPTFSGTVKANGFNANGGSISKVGSIAFNVADYEIDIENNSFSFSKDIVVAGNIVANNIGSLTNSLSSHISAGNPHSITLDKARQAGNELLGPVVIKSNLPGLTIQPQQDPTGEPQVRFSIANAGGSSLIYMSSDGKIYANEIEVNTLTYSESGTTEGDLEVNGSLTVARNATIGSDHTQDVLLATTVVNIARTGGTVAISLNPSNGKITATDISATVDGINVGQLAANFDSHNHDDRYYTKSEIDSMGMGGIYGTTITIEAGETEATWNHGNGKSSYVVSCTPHGFERHVAVTNKLDNQCTVSIDWAHSEDIEVDLILVNY